jgi:hypothetical protein
VAAKLALLITTSDDDMLCRCDNYDLSTYCKYCAEVDFAFPWFSFKKNLVAMTKKWKPMYAYKIIVMLSWLKSLLPSGCKCML